MTKLTNLTNCGQLGQDGHVIFFIPEKGIGRPKMT